MPTDAISMLKKEHQEVRAMLEELTETTTRAVKTRQKLVAKIEKELGAHTTIEEEIFYPAVKAEMEKIEDVTLYFEALEEHRLAKLVLRELAQADPSTPEFSAKASVLKELVTHHADEEEKELFPKAKKLLDKSMLEDLQGRMEKRRKQIEQRFTNGKGRSAPRARAS